MEILVYSISKEKIEFYSEINEYIKMSKKYANIKDKVLFNNQIAKAQSSSKDMALKAYDEAYEPLIDGFCIGLDEGGKMFDSFEFSKLFLAKNKVSFFIGGAYGLSTDFKSKMDKIISLSKMTFAHKIAKLVLYEQIFRGLCINANHPYHK
ncbi:23S rRNA (pseudouridine(1915)-N(3))-methyltransferase RlmH [Campylobacter ureolyticus]|uniref:23S rRNA (pseudouridine(1915)-N(3))-methyltransferase RlmH n=1 Tax=Campylobacter ureolyticus TaxID=827 RepID=UPI00215A65DB|nr:23S rRNA (pseudouridine(1915)-N(3))-methyltransferase RlmH [Campylobacter ureolyticus]MCR8699176.1 23S rRNA (pseudouridine(1915)-N(3))-methyltransferase RlmH [Campylobacter ureolyticus]MCZ6150768.1 23S rRNA (pseudouridine(1915)-N(3))-methyltransferase RlmH [Campylobacter ureolyticus]MCZ6155812.1 23S rRNA (pseudouridine(1915)-N(3))-methyltransferase RlmH [Campylobacter ureolyticus]